MLINTVTVKIRSADGINGNVRDNWRKKRQAKAHPLLRAQKGITVIW